MAQREIVTSVEDTGGMTLSPPRAVGSPVASALGEVVQGIAGLAGKYADMEQKKQVAQMEQDRLQKVNEFEYQASQYIQGKLKDYFANSATTGETTKEFHANLSAELTTRAMEFAVKNNIDGAAMRKTVQDFVDTTLAKVNDEWMMVDGKGYYRTPTGDLRSGMSPEVEMALALEKHGSLYTKQLTTEIAKLQIKAQTNQSGLTEQEQERLGYLSAALKSEVEHIYAIDRAEADKVLQEHHMKNLEIAAKEREQEGWREEDLKKAAQNRLNTTVFPLLTVRLRNQVKDRLELARMSGGQLPSTFAHEIRDAALVQLQQEADTLGQLGIPVDEALKQFEPVIKAYEDYAKAAVLEPKEQRDAEVDQLRAEADAKYYAWVNSLPASDLANIYTMKQMKNIDFMSMAMLEDALSAVTKGDDSPLAHAREWGSLAQIHGIKLVSPDEYSANLKSAYNDDGTLKEGGETVLRDLFGKFHRTTRAALNGFPENLDGDLLSYDAYRHLAETKVIPLYQKNGNTKKIEEIQKVLDRPKKRRGRRN